MIQGCYEYDFFCAGCPELCFHCSSSRLEERIFENKLKKQRFIHLSHLLWIIEMISQVAFLVLVFIYIISVVIILKRKRNGNLFFATLLWIAVGIDADFSLGVTFIIFGSILYNIVIHLLLKYRKLDFKGLAVDFIFLIPILSAFTLVMKITSS